MLVDFSFGGLLLIPIVFVVKRKVLREKKSFLILFCISLLCAVLALNSLSSSERGQPNFALLWFSPLYSLLLYRILLIPFWARKKRDPVLPQRYLLETGHVEHYADRLFGFVFLILSIVVPMYLVIKVYF